MGGLSLLAPMAWRNLWRNPRRTWITLAVVAVGLYSILVFAALLDAWARSSRDAALDVLIGSGQVHAPRYLDDQTIAQRMAAPGARLRAVLDGPSVEGWADRVRTPAVIQSEYKTLPAELLGVRPARERAISVVPRDVSAGRYLAGDADGGIVLGAHLAKRLKTRLGKRVIVMAQDATGALAQRSFRVVGLYSASQEDEDRFAFTGIEPAQAMLGIGTDVSEISFKLADDAGAPATVAALKAAGPGLDVRPWTALAPLTAAMNSFMEAFVYIWLWIMFVLMAIGIVNTQLMAVFERVREFGLLQALGMRPRLVLAEVLLESALLIGLGVLAGAAAAVATVLAFSGGVDLHFLARGAEFFGAGHVLYPRLAPAQFAAVSALVWALGVLVALWPAGKAAGSSPAEVMSHAQ
ncbi:MAG: FtsX-like permease family protein [Phenylobacterium sp.]|uniref:ABC transporter permease n=1 Tax=Phenylobacterium sp. TaxID=1871053 RepID=UPI0025DA8853|nr:FtsX-like permease family protein [Phenylobacterium sp.]MBI1199527.1 FtsX-like permease family protein [Phenylobacterium sp.]